MTTLRTAPLTPSPLLSLPGEIRNHIYALALSTSPRDYIDLSLTSNDRRINQLQLTCRQLYRETRLLEFKDNPVKINDHIVESSLRDLLDEKHPSEAKMIFLGLTRSLGLKRLSWIKSLALSNQISAVDHANWSELREMASTMVHLTKVLMNKPSLRVKYIMDHFCRANLLNKLGDDVSDISIGTHGIVLSSVIRGNALEDMWPTTTAVVLVMRESYERTMSIAEKLPALRVVREASLRVKRLGQNQILS